MKRGAFIIFVIVSVFACCAGLIQGQKKGYKTKKYAAPRCAHIKNFSFEGKIKRVKGRLALGSQPFSYEGIVALYKIIGEKEIFLQSYLTSDDGKFEFKSLKPGIYLLKTGTIGPGFNCRDVKVILAPDDKDSSSEDLEIQVELGT